MKYKKKILITTIMLLLVSICIVIYFLFFNLTPKQREEKEVINRTEEIIDMMYEMDTKQEDIKEYALDYKVSTEFLNFSSRNYVNISVADDAETDKIKLKRKDELIKFYDDYMLKLLEICKKNNDYKIVNVTKEKDDYYVELELHSFDMNAYYSYVANFVLLYLTEDGNGGYDLGIDGEKGRIRVMQDVYLGKTIAVKLFDEYLDDFYIEETTNYTIKLVKDEGVWKIEDLNNLQFAFNGGYAKKYIENSADVLLAERQKRVLEIWKKALQSGVIDASDIRNVDNILDK